MNKIENIQNFIRKASITHEGKYGYFLVEENYCNAHTKVPILCNIHGIFQQTPNGHLNGKGCSNCGKESSAKKRSLSIEEFLKAALKIHGGEYDYSNITDFSSANKKILITCKKHGLFHQTPRNHLKGHGCRQCKNELLALPEQEFKEKATEIHQGRYGYEFVHYINNYKKITITCNLHGNFTQKPRNHLIGQGCPECKNGKNEKLTEKFILSLLPDETQVYPQKHFDIVDNNIKTCVFVDFYFELNNKKYIIEYNGEQHYKPVKFGNISQKRAEEKFAKQQNRDMALRKFCKNNNFILFEIDGRKYKGMNIKKLLETTFVLFK